MMKIFLSVSQLDETHPGYVKPFYRYRDYYPENPTSNVPQKYKEDNVFKYSFNQNQKESGVPVNSQAHQNKERKESSETTSSTLPSEKSSSEKKSEEQVAKEEEKKDAPEKNGAVKKKWH